MIPEPTPLTKSPPVATGILGGGTAAAPEVTGATKDSRYLPVGLIGGRMNG